MLRYNLIFLFVLVTLFNYDKPSMFTTKELNEAVDVYKKERFVDSIYNTLSFNEKVGQLFMVAAYSNKNEEHYQSLDGLIENYHIGGLIFFQGGPNRQAKITNRFQEKSKQPLFIGIDAEWGMSMRLDSTYCYPWNMTLGAIQDNSLIEEMGAQMAEQSKRLGVHFTFAPVVDINTNPNNPIIGNRSFGESKWNVTEKSLAYMNGLQKNGVYATAKHFPGHGDTSTDSHHTLPTVTFTKKRIDSIELYPYKKLINNNLASIMVAHLSVPSLEPNKALPTSLSKKVVTNLLKEDLNFKGLIFTDALNMKGASNFKQPGDIDLAAFLAGNDVLLFAENVPKALTKFQEAYQKGILKEERLKESVTKIIKYKLQAGLYDKKVIDLTNLTEDLNQPKYDALNQRLFNNAITTLHNVENIIPITALEKEKIAYVAIGGDENKVFVEHLNAYARVDYIQEISLENTLEKLKAYTKVIVGYHKPDNVWKKNAATQEEIRWINAISYNNKVIVSFFSRPYSMNSSLDYEHIEGLIMAYQNNKFTHNAVAQIVFGALSSKGKLPVSVNDDFTIHEGISTQSLKILGFDVPENQGMDSKNLTQIDTIIKSAIEGKMTPGAQIVVARRGKVIYNKSFGTHTYVDQRLVQNSDIYDVASLTKVLSTLPNIMQLKEKEIVNFDTTLSEMLPVFEGSNKENATLLDMLTHQARFQPWIPFYQNTLNAKKKPDIKYYRSFYSEDFPNKVAENLYLRKDYNDSIIHQIAKSDLLASKKYKYSDFSFILLKEYLELQSNKKLDVLSDEHFYQFMGMNTTSYNPLNKFEKSRIIPTENDNYFRYQTVQGYVHDMAAAMQGGVSGHAGLFSNALDVSKMMQMYLQNGTYGTHQFFTPKTMNEFNTCYFCEDGNRRGVGFDKPQLGTAGPTCGCLSLTSFGHTGFTGTMAWADPDKEIVYVFLSNRTYPDSKAVNKLSRENIRENIQKVIYESIRD